MRYTVLATAIVLAAMGTATAGEGMWVPQQLPEIAGPAVFLASSLASYVTGVTLPVDGGRVAV